MKKNKRNGLLKGVLALSLVMATAVSALAGCNNKGTEPTKPIDQNPGGGEIITPVEQKETAIVIAKDIVEKAGLQAAYDNAIMGIVEDKYQEVENITSVEIVAGTNGKLTIVANVKDANNEAKEVTLEYEGDTTAFAGIESTNKSVANLTAQILAELGIDAGDEFVKDSNGYKELATAVSAKLDEQKAKITAISSLDSASIIEKQAVQPEIEYVSVQSIVDEIWGDVDTDADIKSIAKYLTETKYGSGYNIDKTIAIDYQEGKLSIYSQITSKKNSKYVFIMKSDVMLDEESTFYNYVKNKEQTFNELLLEKALSINQEIEKNSTQESDLKSVLNTEKNAYCDEKNVLLSLASNYITESSVFAPTILSESQMESIGVESMNEFAYALQSNTRGTGYEYVDDWTMDDVVQTYVRTPSAPNISGISSYRIYVLLNSGIKEFAINVANGSGLDAYRKTLIDSADANLVGIQDDVVYSDDAIVYDSEGQRIAENIQNQNASLYSIEVDGNIIGFYDSKNEKLY